MQPTRRILMIAAAAAALAGPVLAAAPVVQPEVMSLGSAKAKIQVIEYASLACPHCAHFNAEVFPSLKAKWIDTGKVRYTLKEMLTEPVNVAAAGFLMARCAGPAKYFKVVDEVFKSQTQWTAGAKIKPILQQIAAANGLDEARFNACLQDDAAVQAVAARAQRAGEQDDVHQTPTIFINGKRIEPTPMTAADMDAALTAAAKGGK
jgi:protein-disulfide isomerase